MANKLTLSAVGFLSLLAAGMFAQTATTTPVGFITITLPDGTSTPSQTAVYFGLTDSPTGSGVLVGKISGVSPNTITSSGAGWTAGAFSIAATPYMVRITSGVATGTTWQVSTSVPNTAETLTLSDAGLDLVALGVIANDTFEILPLDTLATLFTSELQGGQNETVADNVQLWNGNAWVTYFYNTTRSRWERAKFGTIANDIVIRPDTGCIITRRGPAKSLVLIGRAPATDLRIRFGVTRESFVGTFPYAKTLSQIGLQSTAGWVASTTESLADKVMMWNGGAWVSYYFDGTNWRRAKFGTISNDTPVQTPERPILISKVTPPTQAVFLNQAKSY
jgi:uncharacterized protein (TIGR02597 family)